MPLPVVAIVGRPNVGKSSLANRLAGHERVVVSNVPGTTRDAVDIRLDHDDERYTLVDTAGLRSPGRRTRTAEHVSALMALRSLERAGLITRDDLTARIWLWGPEAKPYDGYRH